MFGMQGAELRLCLCAVIVFVEHYSWKRVSIFIRRHGCQLILDRYLSTLEERLALVEQRLGDVEASTSAAQPTRPNSRGPRAHFDEEELQSTGQANGIQSISDEFALQDSSDGMGAMVFTDEEDCGFFGKHFSHRSGRRTHGA